MKMIFSLSQSFLFCLLAVSVLAGPPPPGGNVGPGGGPMSAPGFHPGSGTPEGGPRPGPAPIVLRPGPPVTAMPSGAISIRVGNGSFFFSAGVFYQWSNGSYCVVQAPPGIIVPILPVGYSMQVVGNSTYYVFNGTYYRQVPSGYVVVAEPVVSETVVAASIPVATAPTNVTVWLQNGNGSRTPVVMRPGADGQWIGPKGEYYGSFPTHAQLEPVYGLKSEGSTVETPQTAPTHTVWINNANGSKIPVTLTQNGQGQWVGPQGEIYDNLPEESVLKATYGLDQ